MLVRCSLHFIYYLLWNFVISLPFLKCLNEIQIGNSCWNIFVTIGSIVISLIWTSMFLNCILWGEGSYMYVWPVEPNEAPHVTSYTCSRLTYPRFHRAMFSAIATFRYSFSSAYYFVMQPMYQSSGSGSGQTGNTSVGLKQHWLDSHVSDVRGFQVSFLLRETLEHAKSISSTI